MSFSQLSKATQNDGHFAVVLVVGTLHDVSQLGLDTVEIGLVRGGGTRVESSQVVQLLPDPVARRVGLFKPFPPNILCLED